MEDNSHEDHEWFGSLHVDAEYYWVVPAVELGLLVPIHLYHCALRRASSVRWQGDPWLLGKLLATALVVCDALHELTAGVNTVPLSRVLRPFFLLDLYSGVRKIHNQCVAALASLKELMLLALVVLFFFVLAGLMVYPVPGDEELSLAEGEGARGTSQGVVVFVDLFSRISQLIYLSVGAVNYPGDCFGLAALLGGRTHVFTPMALCCRCHAAFIY